MATRLVVVGLSHRSAPLELREKAALREEEIAPFTERLRALPGVSEALVLSTCNRVELYAAVERDDTAAALIDALCATRQLICDRSHFYSHHDRSALQHLLRVACSLDSLVVGEPQILGQVKQAYARAQAAAAIGPLLQRVFPRAFQIAKRVRSETELGKNSASVASVAVDLAAQIFGDLQGRHVLIVGAGKMAELSVRHLHHAGTSQLTVVNRTFERAEKLATRLSGAARPWSELDALLADVDIVITSTGAAAPVLGVARMKAVMRKRKGRWLLVVDIALPRDVEPAVSQLDNLYLYDMDALEHVVVQNRAGREHEAAAAEALVVEELDRFLAGERAQALGPTLAQLRERFHAVARTEVQRLAKRKSEAEQAELLAVAESIVNKLLHAPLMAAKRAAEAGEGEELEGALLKLFDLDAAIEADLAQLESGAQPRARKGARGD